MRVALLSASAQAGDAIGNQLAEKLTFFVERGAAVTVFLETDQRLHPRVAPHAHVLPHREPHGEAWDYLSSADLVIAEHGHYYPLLELLPLLAGGKPRILFDYHGITPPELWGAHNREGLERGLRQRGLVWCADAAVAHSRFTCRELAAATGFPTERTVQLGHPIDTERFRPGPPRQCLRDQLGLGPAALLLYVGRLAPNKRLPVLVEALAQLRDRTPAVHALVVGDSGDCYRTEAERCRQRAVELALADRLHFLGHIDDDRLLDAYRSADVFVMPSRHEGFCIPLIEAMACGLQVVAARAGALPETVGDAGLTFTPDDAADLARQVRRVLDGEGEKCEIRNPKSEMRRLAVVACRYGNDFVGGAETSLRTIAENLSRAGHSVEVFSTCTRAEHDWTDQCSEGTTVHDGICVHRFPIDPHDHERHLASLPAIVDAHGPVSREVEEDYLAHSIHSSRLLQALRQRIDKFDAVIVGPYLFGLTHDVAGEFPDRTLLLPCFHDEPFARLQTLRETYERVGGILYHSPEEQAFAQNDLGLNHPGAVCIGTCLVTETPGDAERGRKQVGTGRRYLVYCGRYSPQKNLPLLLDHARGYSQQHPQRFTFVFMGQGDVSIPDEPWTRDLGFVSDESRRDVLAGAAALVQLSHYESLSLVALEAWAQGVPLLAAAACQVLAGQLRRCQGGRAVDSYEAFSAALDDLWERPQRWRVMGAQGRAYVRSRYGSPADFTDSLVNAVRSLAMPLAERMRRRGLLRAAENDRSVWRDGFGRLIEDVLHAPPRPYREDVEVRSRGSHRTVAAGCGTTLVPVQVLNRGTHAIAHEGPARRVLRTQLLDATGTPLDQPEAETPLPALLLPGQAVAAAVAVPVPARPGSYSAAFRVESAERCPPQSVIDHRQPMLQLIVEEGQRPAAAGCCAPLLETVQAAVVRANQLQRLPCDYTDVTEGRFAVWKRWIKRKLLGNFKHAYVDVLSRQQSAFNQEVVRSMTELAECCATLDHARKLERDPLPSEPPSSIRTSLAALHSALADLEGRLARLEEAQVPR